jgi:hypothetical protein
MIYKILVVVFGYLVSVACGHLIRIVLRKYGKDMQSSGIAGAGFVIGALERVLILTFVLVGEYNAITMIFAGKSIARFEALKDRKTAEYYLIGTFLSISFALGIGILVRLINKGLP